MILNGNRYWIFRMKGFMENKRHMIANKKKISFKKIVKSFLYTLLKLLGIILLAICLRVFFFASFKIPSPSMEPTLVSGDFVLVNKLIPGPRLVKNFDFLDGEEIKFKRLKGIRRIRRNDVVVFHYPYSQWGKLRLDLNTYYIKRCIAIPGDTFFIDNGIYKVKNTMDTLGNYPNQRLLSQRPDDSFPKGVFRCFPKDSLYHWTIKNFGPLYLPRANETLSIDRKNIPLYKNLIEYETQQQIQVRDSQVFLGNKQIQAYTFRQNYYFMSGDYVTDSKDSRYWGLLPEDHIVGKAFTIWKSKDENTGKYRFNRFFKSIP